MLLIKNVVSFFYHPMLSFFAILVYPSIVSSSLVAIQNSEGACLLLLGKIYLIGQSPEDFLSHVKFSFFLDVASFSGFQIRIALSFFSLADAQLISC